ncbi:MAG: hypothetical protein AVDCRST_MAG85-2646, partial [uncultured Solirubrobacteraceae bacterium]
VRRSALGRRLGARALVGAEGAGGPAGAGPGGLLGHPLRVRVHLGRARARERRRRQARRDPAADGLQRRILRRPRADAVHAGGPPHRDLRRGVAGRSGRHLHRDGRRRRAT